MLAPPMAPNSAEAMAMMTLTLMINHNRDSSFMEVKTELQLEVYRQVHVLRYQKASST